MSGNFEKSKVHIYLSWNTFIRLMVGICACLVNHQECKKPFKLDYFILLQIKLYFTQLDRQTDTVTGKGQNTKWGSMERILDAHLSDTEEEED